MEKITRRTALGTLLGAVGLATKGLGADDTARSQEVVVKENLKQSVSRWCYGKLSLEDLCKNAAGMGIQGIDLLGVEEAEVPPKHGLVCALANGPGGIGKGWNRVENHDELMAKSEELLPRIAKTGAPNVVMFSGNREGLPDDQGLENCVKGFKRVAPLAEKLGLTVCIELLNSKRDHKDYQCDRTAWGAEICKQVGSERLKLLYDVYHMQIMEGDVIATIKEFAPFIGHYHTGGVPGRNEIDETQELNYRRICQAIVETGFQGYLAHEFVPKRDPLESLKQAVSLCDV